MWVHRLAARAFAIKEVSVVKALRMLFLLSLAFGVVLSAGSPALGQSADDKALDGLLESIRGDLVPRRDSAMSTLIQLNDEEAKAFWPLKKQYDAELRKLYDTRLALMKEFAASHKLLTREVADDLADRFLDLERNRTELHRKYFKLMAKQVSPVAAAQFLQLQAQFEAMAEVQLMSSAPLAGM